MGLEQAPGKWFRVHYQNLYWYRAPLMDGNPVFCPRPGYNALEMGVF